MYCSLYDLKAAIPELRLIELTDDQNPNETGQVNEQIVLEAVAGAESLIDSHLSSRYLVPFNDPVPRVLRKICTDLTVCALYDRQTETQTPEGIKGRYKEAMALLSALADGKMSLAGIATQSTESVPGAAHLVSDRPSLFNMDSMRF